MIPHRRWRKPVKLRVRTLPAVLFGLAAALAWDSSGTVRMGLLCAVLHEAGHLAAWTILFRSVPTVTLSLTGLCLSLRGELPGKTQEILLAMAGPAVNLALCILCLVWMEYVGGYTYPGYRFACVNLLLGAFNLLPLPGLDGGRLAAVLLDELHFTGK